ncbi:HNH endonuclease signature motif containing protein [Streptomyces platensis]|uniref:HNH endonuclease signature motif containing protein n=1 Tax=Streptomyces platensis TaxID=58346 RepID=UPI0033FA6AD3
MERWQQHLSPQPDGCIHWTGCTEPYGYGAFSQGGKQRPAHRVAYEMFVGPIPDGAHIDHVCHNRDLTCQGGNTCMHRRCVNPEHLEPVTILENLRRSPLVPYGAPPREACPQGHALTEDNTYIHPSDGTRKCRKCIRDRHRAAYAPKPPKPPRDTCHRGHPLSGENVYHHAGRRACRECRRINARERYWRSRQ